MERSGIELIRTQIQPLKPNQKITKITKNQNTKRIPVYGQPGFETQNNKEFKECGS